jgi:MFS family permease
MRAALTIFAIWVAGLGAAGQFGKMSVAYPVLEEVYSGHAGIGIGVMLSIVGTVGLIFGTTSGLLVARIGPKRAMLAALALGAVVSAVQTALPPYAVMLASRVLEGFSHLAIVVVGPTAIAGLAGSRGQGAAMTLWSSFFGVAYAVLFWIGPQMMSLQGPAFLFATHAVWMAASAVILWVLLPDDPKVDPVKNRASIWNEHLAIYASPFHAAPAMGFACYAVTYVAVLTLLPAQMGDRGDSSGWQCRWSPSQCH